MIFQLVIVSFHIFTNKMDIFYWSMIIGGRPKFEGSNVLLQTVRSLTTMAFDHSNVGQRVCWTQ